VPARIVSAIDDNKLVTLVGNVHPLARPEFDRGPVADGQALHRMLLVCSGARRKDCAAAIAGPTAGQSVREFSQMANPAEYGVQFDRPMQTCKRLQDG